MRDPDDLSYLLRATRQQRDKAFQTLDGILRGINADGVVDSQEVHELSSWANAHRRLDKDASFKEVLDVVGRALADGKIEPDEVEDIRFVCANAATSSQYFDDVTHAIQRLHGCLHGVVANQKINAKELKDIEDWVDEYSVFRKIFPITEIEALILEVMRDGKIDTREHERLLCVFEHFVTPSAEYAKQRNFSERPPISIGGVCAVDPEVIFPDKCFCFTGISEKGTRKELTKIVYTKGGHCADSVVTDLDYLVIGGMSNPCWAFSCYGRKVERAMELRRDGSELLIIQERDFWDSIR